MRSNRFLFGLVLTILATAATEGRLRVVTSPAAGFECPVTKPNGIVADGGEPDRNSYGNRQLSVGPFGLWPDGTVVFKPGGAGFVTQDGSLGMKFGWQRGVRGELKIDGRRLDAQAPALRAHVPNGYEPLGFQATSLIFATPGCWEVTGHVGDASVTFVTMVVQIGDGPAWRRDFR